MTGLTIILAAMTAAIVFAFVTLTSMVRQVLDELQKHYDIHDMRYEATGLGLSNVRDEIRELKAETMRRNNEARSWEAEIGTTLGSCNYFARRATSEVIEVKKTIEALAKPDKNTKKQIDKAVKSSERTLKMLAELHSLSERYKFFNK